MLESRLDIRVEWGHCDPAQIVYNPNFFDWMERGMTALFMAGGIRPSNPADGAASLVRSEANFIAPARTGDVLTLSSRVTRWGRSSFDLAHTFLLDGERVAEAIQTRVWSGDDPETGRLTALPIPEALRKALSEDKIVHQRIDIVTLPG